ncbi:hypothetical protein RAA17_13840 [Komagataeibacter rhaeticus]|nr:hypothetical protein [Komagataeibacter rhaeticus]
MPARHAVRRMAAGGPPGAARKSDLCAPGPKGYDHAHPPCGQAARGRHGWRAGRATGYAGAMMARTGAYRAWRRARRTAAGGPPHA